jgi:hypothetical protein
MEDRVTMSKLPKDPYNYISKVTITLTREVSDDNVAEFQLAMSYQWDGAERPYITKAVRVLCSSPRGEVIHAMLKWAHEINLEMTKEELEEAFDRLDRKLH